MKVVWPTRSRSGSQFVLQLTTACLGLKALTPQARINGCRVDTFGKGRCAFQVRDGVPYLRGYDIQSLKYEDPGKDDFILEVAREFPEAKFVASYRPLIEVLESHYNLRSSWGHDEADVLHQFKSCLELYETLYEQGRLCMVDVNLPQLFSPEKFAGFLGVAARAEFLDFVTRWEPTNTLDYQQAKSGTAAPRKEFPNFDALLRRNPWALKAEADYRQLCKETSQI